MDGIMEFPIKINGKVINGKRKGHTVGMPTANILYNFENNNIEYGVYASYVYIDNKKYKGVTNVGLRPSVDSSNIPTVETHILDFDEDIYGKDIEVELVFYIRSVQKFNGLEEVKKQVDKDIMKAREKLHE